MIDSLEYFLNRDEHGNLRTQQVPISDHEPWPEESETDLLEDDNDEELDESYLNYPDEEDDDDAIDRKYRGEED